MHHYRRLSSKIGNLNNWYTTLFTTAMPIVIDLGSWVNYLPNGTRKEAMRSAMSDYLMSSITADRIIDINPTPPSIVDGTYGILNFTRPTIYSGNYVFGSDPSNTSTVVTEILPDPQFADILSVLPDGNALLTNPIYFQLWYQTGSFYLWQPICREGTTALSMVVTTNNTMPSKFPITCLADRCVSPCDKTNITTVGSLTFWYKNPYVGTGDIPLGFGVTTNLAVANSIPWCVKSICSTGILNPPLISANITGDTYFSNLSCSDTGSCKNTDPDPTIQALIVSSSNNSVAVGLGVGLTFGILCLLLGAVVLIYVFYQKRRGKALVPPKIKQKFSKFKVGSKCVALYEKDGNYYKGVIDSVDFDNNKCLVRWSELDGSREWIKMDFVSVQK